MNPNTHENVSENPENRQKNSDWRQKFLRKFNAEVSAMSDTTRKNDLIEDICTKEANTPEIISKKEEVLSNNRGELGEIDLEKVSIFDLRKGLTRDFFRLENIKNSYIGELHSKFDILAGNLNTIRKELKTKDFSEIKKLTENTQKSEEFLTQTLKKLPKSRTVSDIFSEIDAKRLNKIKDVTKREAAQQALALMANGTFRASDIETLYETGFLNKKEKGELFKKYYKTISLADAVKYKLVTEAEATRKKESVIRRIINNKKKETELKQLKNDSLELIGNNLDNKDVFLTIDDLDLDEKTIDQYVKTVGFKKMEDEFYDVQKSGEAEREKKGPKNFRDFKEILEEKYSRQILGLAKFQSGNYLEITKTENKDGASEEIKTVYEIVSEDNGNNGFTLKAVGVGDDIDINSSSQSEKFLYVNFLSLLEKSGSDFKLSVNCLDKKELKRQLEDPTNSRFKENSFTSYDADSLSDGTIQNHHIEKLETELQALQKQLKENPNDDFLKDLIKRKEDKIKRIKNSSKTNLLQELNLEKLTEQIDGVDPEGKNLGLYSGMYLESDAGVAEIEGIDVKTQEVVIDTGDGKQKISFASFFAGVKKHKLKRVRKYSDFSEFLDAFKKEGKEIPDNYVFESGKFIAKDVDNGGKTESPEVEFFEGKNGEVVKIESINGSQVTIRLGEKRNPEKKNDAVKYILSMQKKTETLSLNSFKRGLLAKEMVPDWKIGNKNVRQEPEKGLDNKFHNSFGSRFMNRLSLMDLFSAGKLWVDNIHEHLKKGSDVAAAKQALKWGKLLPTELRNSLEIKVESFEREEMDKATKSLSEIDSKKAAAMAESWILNVDSPQYKKEAATLWVIGKYGNLTSKRPLNQHRGKFIFYQGLGGRIGDKLYNETKEKYENASETFNEELLVLELLKQQCEGRHPSGIKRTSKLYKDYQGRWDAGIKSEVEDGYNAASDMRSVKDIVDYAHGEISGGTTSNGIGALKRLLERGGSMEDLNEVYFTLLYSGTLYNVSQKLFMQLKSQVEAGNPLPLALFGSDGTTMKSTNLAILEMSKQIGKADPEKYGPNGNVGNIAKDAQDIFDDVHAKRESLPKIYENTKSFYKKYGKVLSRSLNMIDSDEEEFKKTDKLLLEGKNKNPALKKYYDNIKENSGEDFFFGDDQMVEWGAGEGFTGLDTLNNIRKFLQVNANNAYSKPKLAPKIWESIIKSLYSTNSKLLDASVAIDSLENKNLQRKQVLENLREIFAGLRYNHSGKTLSLYNKVPGVSRSLKEWGVTDILTDFGDIEPDDILKGKNQKSERILSRVAGMIVGGAVSSSSEDSGEGGFDMNGPKALDSISNVTEEIKSANDEVFEQRQTA